MDPKRNAKLGVISGVYIPVCIGIFSILMFLRFSVILGHVGLLGAIGLLVCAYVVNLLTILSLSAIATNGEVKGGGAYYLISRSLGPEFGGSIGVLFYLAHVLNTALNVVGLIDCIRSSLGPNFASGLDSGFVTIYGLQTGALIVCFLLCLAGSAVFTRANLGLLIVLSVAIVSIPVSALLMSPFSNSVRGINFTGFSTATLRDNLLPRPRGPDSPYHGLETFRRFFGILFPATSGIFAGATLSGDLRDPSRAIPKGTLWAMLTTFCVYVMVMVTMAASLTHDTFLAYPNVIPATNLSPGLVLAGECAITFVSALLALRGSAKLLQALARDRLLPGLAIFGQGTRGGDEPHAAIVVTYLLAQVALLADLNRIATLVAMGYQMTFFIMNLACFLLKIGAAPNFRPGFRFFSWQTALAGAVLCASAMFFVDETKAATAICMLLFLFLLIHYMSPPKRWGDVSQNLIYHQVRKYLLRLRPEHIKFWRPQIILLVNNPRRQTRLIQFCNSLKKGALYILGHVIVADDFAAGVQEAKLQQAAWSSYISESSRIKAFVQLAMSPSITWGVRNLILSAGLGGMRPNIAVIGFYNLDELRASSKPPSSLLPPPPAVPASPAAVRAEKRREEEARGSSSSSESGQDREWERQQELSLQQKQTQKPGRQNRAAGAASKDKGKRPSRRMLDTSARLLEGFLPTDVIRTEGSMPVTEYMTMLEDLALRFKLNVAVAKGFENLESPWTSGLGEKRYIDLWPIQISAEVVSEGRSVLTTNFDTYTLILQLGYILASVSTWKRAYRLRVLVFVEYEWEVDEERARVQSLLEKLRIPAEVRVFYLAAGDLPTYELLVNGSCDDPEAALVADEVLRDEEWWNELQASRRSSPSPSPSQMGAMDQQDGNGDGNGEVADKVEGGIDSGIMTRRRPSIMDLDLLGRNPTASGLSRLGINLGIHTQHLGSEVIDEVDSEVDSDDSSLSGRQDVAEDVLGADADADADADLSDVEAARVPLLPSSMEDAHSGGRSGSMGGPMRRMRQKTTEGDGTRSYGTMSDRRDERGGEEKNAAAAGPSKDRESTRRARREGISGRTTPKKGVGFAAAVANDGDSATRRKSEAGHSGHAMTGQDDDADDPFRTRLQPQPRSRPQTPTNLQNCASSDNNSLAAAPLPSILTPIVAPATRPITPSRLTTEPTTPSRPPLSRQSSAARFSSRPVPEARVDTSDPAGPTIMFAAENQGRKGGGGGSGSHGGNVTPTTTSFSLTPSPTAVRPGFSRQSSVTGVRFSSRPVPETVSDVSQAESGGATIGFATTDVGGGVAGGPIAVGTEPPPTPRTRSRTRSRKNSVRSMFNGQSQDSFGAVGNPPGPRRRVNASPERSDETVPDPTGGAKTHSSLPDLSQPPPRPQPSSSTSQQTKTASPGMTASSSSTSSPSPASLSSSSPAYQLSFNDLPSRAQHLILNELMQRESGAGRSDTGVVFSTLPVPAEGVGADEEAATAYLSNVEVLCAGLPPVLMVLSNSMTVTVSL